MKMDLKSKVFKTQTKTYIWQSVLVTLVIASFIFILGFCPDFIFNLPNATYKGQPIYGYSQASYGFSSYFLYSDDIKNVVAGSFRFSFAVLMSIFAVTAAFVSTRYVIYFLTFKPWFKKQLDISSQIIKSCNISSINVKVALVVETCNDFTPSTVLQSIKQTYKNIDVWLLDDSTNGEYEREVSEFGKKYNCNVLRRPNNHKQAHKTMIGNLMYFINQHGKEYDFICEIGASSIITNTFVENGLCFFLSPLTRDVNVGAVGGCGSFYPINTLFGGLAGKSTQFADAHTNAGASFRTSGTNMYVNGGASLYKSSVLQSIPLEDVECPSCDVARSFGMAQHNITCFQNPYDFSGKLVTQNIYRFSNQRLKGCGGDSFIFKKYCHSKFSYKPAGFYAKSNYFLIITSYIALFVFAFANNILFIACNSLGYINLTSILLDVCLGLLLAIIFIILCGHFKASFGLLIITGLNGLFEIAIIFRKMYTLVFTSLIRGKGSSGAISVKTREKLDAKTGGKICKIDVIGLLFTVLLCVSLTCVSHFIYHNTIMSVIIGFNIFFFLAIPSIAGLISTIFVNISTKKGGKENLPYYDIAANDFRFKYVKETELGQRQHGKENKA